VRLAEDPATPLSKVIQCRAHALGNMRQAQGALRALERMQARRQKTQANDEARDYAATLSTHALSQMTEALNAPPPPPRPSRSWQAPEPTTDVDPEKAPSPCGRGLGEGAAPTDNSPPSEPAQDTDSHQLVPPPEDKQPAHPHTRSPDWPWPERPHYQNGSLVPTDVGADALQCPTATSPPNSRTPGSWPTG